MSSCSPSDMVKGLDYVHAQRVIHGDIKPANILIDFQARAKLSDFGSSAVIPHGSQLVKMGEVRDCGLAQPLLVRLVIPRVRCGLCSALGRHNSLRPNFSLWTKARSMTALQRMCTHWVPLCLRWLWDTHRFVQQMHCNLQKRCKLRGQKFLCTQSGSCVFSLYLKLTCQVNDCVIRSELDPFLRDLLKKMLKKDPRKRIRLADVMCHEWVTVEGSEPLSIVSLPVSIPVAPATLSSHASSRSLDSNQLVLAEFDSVVDVSMDMARSPKQRCQSAEMAPTRNRLKYGTTENHRAKKLPSPRTPKGAKLSKDWSVCQVEARTALLARVRARQMIAAAPSAV